MYFGKIFVALFFSVVAQAAGVNGNRYIQNRDIQIDDKRIKILAEDNASYSKSKRVLTGLEQEIESQGGYQEKGETPFEPRYESYRLEVKRNPDLSIQRISEALSENYYVYQESDIVTHRFDKTGNLMARTECAGESRTSRGIVINKASREVECLTLTKGFCELARANKTGLEIMDKIDENKIAECSDVLYKVTGAWERVHASAKNDEEYKAEAEAEKQRMQGFLERSVKGISPSYTFSENDKVPALAAVGKNSSQLWTGWRGLYRFQRTLKNCATYFPVKAETAGASGKAKDKTAIK